MSIVPVARIDRGHGPGIVAVWVLVGFLVFGGVGPAHARSLGAAPTFQNVEGNGPCPGPQEGT